MLVKLLEAYRQGGNEALGEYRDKKHPARIADEFETMLRRASVLPDVVPQLRRYLLDYPNAPLPDADSYFYATHYFYTALDVSACITDGHSGFYLLTLKGSQQEGLTGVKAAVLRKVVVGKTRDSLERALGAIKRMVEHPA
jgi:hypothetical protein